MKRKQKAVASAPQPDSTAIAREAEESAEKKVIAIWKAFDQIFGLRWAQSFGNDPTGKDRAENRMDQWIAAVKFMAWPQVNRAIERIRSTPKPYDGWLPDLQAFIQHAGKPPTPVDTTAQTYAAATWVDKVCTSFMMAWAYQFPIPPKGEYEEALGKVYLKMRADFNALLKEDPELEPMHVAKNLLMALSKVPAPHLPPDTMTLFRKTIDETVKRKLEAQKGSSATRAR